jgi:hypothetical protein
MSFTLKALNMPFAVHDRVDMPKKIDYISRPPIVVLNDDLISMCQANATLNFSMHLQASFAAC